jgi:hypothetical protein
LRGQRIYLREVRGFMGVFNAAFSLSKQHFGTIARAFLLIVGPVLLLFLMADTWFEAEIGGYFDKVWDYAKGADYDVHEFYWNAVMLFLSVRFIFFLCELLFMSITAEFFVLYQKSNLKTVNLKVLLAALKKDVSKIIGAGVIWCLIYFMIYGLLALLYLKCAEMGASAVFLVGPLLILVVILCGLQLEYMLAAAVQICMIEQVSPLTAFKRSAQLMFPSFWTTWLVFIVLRILLFLSVYIFMLPMIFAGFAAGYFGGIQQVEDNIIYIIATMIGMFLYYIISGFYFMFTGVHYYNLVERKDGTGIKERISSLGKKDESRDVELYY